MSNQVSTKHSKNANSFGLKRIKDRAARKARQQMSPLMQMFQRNLKKLYWQERQRIILG